MIDKVVPSVEEVETELRSKRLPVLGQLLPVFVPLVLFALAGNWLGLETIAGGLALNLGFILSVLVASLVLWRRGTGWREVGLSPPRSWARTVVLALGAFLGALLVQIAVQLLPQVLPGLALAPPDMSRFNPLTGNLPLYLLMLVLSWTTIAFGEEMIYRAFLINQLTALFQRTPASSVLAVVGSGLVFGLAHFAEGPVGIASNGAFGLLFGWIYLRTGRNLWITIVAHGLLNTLRFTLLYMQAL